MSAPTDTAEHWLSIAEAAPKLGLSAHGLKTRVRRGTLPARKDNRGRLLVAVPTSMLASAPVAAPTSTLMSVLPDQLNGHDEVERWRTAAETARLEAASLRAERDAVRELVASLQTMIGDLKGDREALQGQLAQAHAELAHARKGWLERVLEAVRRR
jgi:hypothetical protein